MSAKRSISSRPVRNRFEPALALPSLFPKAPPNPPALDMQAIALAEMRHELLFAVDAKNGLVLDVNPSALHRLGLERDQAIGRRLTELLHLEDIFHYLADLPAGRPVRFTQRMTLNGEDRPASWEFRVVLLAPPAETTALITARPLEERHTPTAHLWTQHLSLLPAAFRRAREMTDAQPLFDWLHALPSVRYAAQFRMAPDSGLFQLIFPAAGTNTIPRTLPAGLASAGASRILLAGDPSADWIERSRAAAVIFFPQDDSILPQLLVVGLHDAESALTVSALLPAFTVALHSLERSESPRGALPEQSGVSVARAALQALLDELPQALVLINGKDGRAAEASASCERMLGYSTPAMAAMPLEDWLIAPEAVVAVRAACETGRIHESGELTLYRRDGEGFPAQVRAIPLPVPAGLAAHDVLVVITDLTSHREARQESRHLQRQAVLGWMAASFAHEIRNPLNNLSLQLEEMRTLHKLEPDVEKLALESQNECRRLTEISRRMLDFARGQDFHPAPTDMAALVRRVLQRMQPALDRAGVRSLFSVAENLPQAMADALSIEQVILNLIENAAKAMPDGGHLGVSLELSALESGAPAVEVRVADTGQGLPPEVREKLFQPYVTTRADGHGLGLALSRHIIDAHRGALRAETYPGSGTVFRVFLPVASEA